MLRIFFALALTFGLLIQVSRLQAQDGQQVKVDEQILENAGLKTDGDALLKFFRQRTLTENDRLEVEALIKKLGSGSFRMREQATAKLIARGPVIIELLREVLKSKDLEVSSRAERCLQKIREKDFPPQIPAAVARLVRDRKPKEAAKILLNYLPFASNESVAEEVRETLANLAVVKGVADPILVEALTSKEPLIRGAAGEALTLGGDTKHQAELRKLMTDPIPEVRLRVAMALAMAKDKDAVPAIINLLPELPQIQAWRAEDLLLRIAQDHNPPSIALGKTAASKEKARAVWETWWKENKGVVNLAKLRERKKLLGYTVVVLLDAGRVQEVGARNEVRWQVDNLALPLDIEMLPGDRLLVAEYNASRVTLRDLKGEILWQKRVIGPLVAQRLANGNTFIATDGQLMEMDKNDNITFSFSFPTGERIMKALKLNNGEVLCMTDSQRIVRLDGKGREVGSFHIDLGKRLFGGRLYTTPGGNILVPHNAENKVVEYDRNGKAVWELAIDQPVAAVRLPNGNTLVTTYEQNRAVEFDRAGNEVWEYQSNTKLTRALRR